MTDEERERAMHALNHSIRIANKFGPLIIDDAGQMGGTAATAAAILLSTFCAEMDMSLHDTVGLLMTIHKQTMALEREK